MGDQLTTKSPIEFKVYYDTTGNFITKIYLQIAIAKSTSILLIFIRSWNSILVVDSSIAKLRKVNTSEHKIINVLSMYKAAIARTRQLTSPPIWRKCWKNRPQALVLPYYHPRYKSGNVLFTSGIHSWCVWTHWIMQFKPIHQMYIPPEVFFSHRKGDQKRWRNTGIEQIIQPICSHLGQEKETQRKHEGKG